MLQGIGVGALLSRLVLLISLGLVLLYSSAIELAKNAPLHMAMPEQFAQVANEKMVFTLAGTDSLLKHQVWLLSDVQQKPLLYCSDVITPVCIDGLCKPMYITLYWNLVGHYVGYGVFPDNLLTKFDHEAFTPADYTKLHTLLLDQHSILERKTMEDLFDQSIAAKEKITFNGEEVDAVSGATRAEIKESVVEGALYSCFTAWHLAHGDIKEQIEQHLLSYYDPALAESFLKSSAEDYQLFALKQLNSTTLVNQLSQIQEIFKHTSPGNRLYILKKLPRELWKDEKVSQFFFQTFASVDINTRTLLLNNLKYAHPSAVNSLVENLEQMSKNQLSTFLNYLAENRQYLNGQVKTKLAQSAQNKSFTENYVIESFLKSN
ncbi:MAG: hypothetical protein SFV55_18140 [Haliscomenobacter sp.]|uniref:hypothetical protein n=1 Tax=Haliscomenobacter sp. TaxID=2717303 RepID=UPI0029A9182B|nr:hypothetical protein [Haliscomenobacter sp.]MDX2070355.1 hypothetical protein [Haliscomenobacter sp.]